MTAPTTPPVTTAAPIAVQNHHFPKTLLDAVAPGAGTEVVTSAPGGA